MQTILMTIAVAFVIFALAFSALVFGYLCGKKRDKCSCSAAKRVMKEIDTRQKNAKNAENYDPKTLNPDSLPIIENDFPKRKSP